MISEIAPQSQSRLSEEFWPPQEDCTARVRAGQVLSARLMARSSFRCFSSEATGVVVDAMFAPVCDSNCNQYSSSGHGDFSRSAPL